MVPYLEKNVFDTDYFAASNAIPMVADVFKLHKEDAIERAQVLILGERLWIALHGSKISGGIVQELIQRLADASNRIIEVPAAALIDQWLETVVDWDAPAQTFRGFRKEWEMDNKA